MVSKLDLIRVLVAGIAALSCIVFANSYVVSDAAPMQALFTAKTSDGLRTVTVENEEGRVTVKLPDDIRTGDKISGTLVTEPKGETKEQQDANLAALRKRRLRLMLAKASGATDTASMNEPVVLNVPLASGQTSTVKTEAKQGNTLRIEFTASGPATARTIRVKELGRRYLRPPPKRPGRPRGPAWQTPDGSRELLMAIVRIRRLSSPYQPVTPRWELSPARTYPPWRTANEGPIVTAPFRNIGVGLSAPKTSLMRGETRGCAAGSGRDRYCAGV
ncbi:MAG: hypothetical protein IPK98_03590 [Chloracidobacterium sp.]|nr:hypothetical protein [Chloracidobacterium sp.]